MDLPLLHVRGRARLTTAALAALLLLVVLPLTARSAAAAPAKAAPCGTAFPSYQRAAVARGAALSSDLPITMSDGVVLRADVTLPVGRRGPYPVALTISGYGKASPVTIVGGGGGDLVSHGYATVVVDDRGTGSSGGT